MARTIESNALYALPVKGPQRASLPTRKSTAVTAGTQPGPQAGPVSA